MKIQRTLAVLALCFLSAACEDGTSLDAVGLEGTWNATLIEFTNNADTTQVVDIAQRDNASFTLTVDEAGTAGSVFDDGVGGTSSDSGTLNSSSTTLTLGGQTFEATRDGDMLTLVDDMDAFDFGSGSDVPATLRILLSR